MKRTFIFAIAVISALAITLAFAEKPANESPKYDIASEVTIKA